MMASASIERALAEDGFPIRHGVFVAVAGPSGSGKDSLLSYARKKLADSPEVVFVRRVITRPVDPSNEDHDTLDDAAFDAQEAEGAFAVSWQANGLRYALPASVDEVVGSGGVAVANVSRAAIHHLRARYANVVILLVTARPEVLAERLAGRGRETREEIMARLARGTDAALAVEGAMVIDNSEALEVGGGRLVAALNRAVAWSAVSDTV